MISAPIFSARYSEGSCRAPFRWDGCQRSTRLSTAATAKWIATPSSPVAKASA